MGIRTTSKVRIIKRQTNTDVSGIVASAPEPKDSGAVVVRANLKVPTQIGANECLDNTYGWVDYLRGAKLVTKDEEAITYKIVHSKTQLTKYTKQLVNYINNAARIEKSFGSSGGRKLGVYNNVSVQRQEFEIADQKFRVNLWLYGDVDVRDGTIDRPSSFIMDISDSVGRPYAHVDGNDLNKLLNLWTIKPNPSALRRHGTRKVFDYANQILNMFGAVEQS